MPWVNGKWVPTGAYEDAHGTGPAYTGQRDFQGYGQGNRPPTGPWPPPIDPRQAEFDKWAGGDPNEDFQEGADPGSQYRGLAGQYREWNPEMPDWSQRDQDIAAGNESRNAYLSSLQMSKDAMSGQNSVAQRQLGAQTQQGLNAQAALAGSARGGGLAQAAAQRRAMVAGNQALTAQPGQNALLGAKEAEMARQQYAQQANKLRAMDLMQRGMSAEEAMKQADMELSNRLGAGELGMGYEQLSEGGRENALNRAQQMSMQRASNSWESFKRRKEAATNAVTGFLGGLGGLMGGIAKGHRQQQDDIASGRRSEFD